MKMSENTDEIVKSLAKIQKDIKSPSKDSVNPYFDSKYASLDSVIKSYKEICNKNDVIVMENPVSVNHETGKQMVGVEIMLFHSSGQYMRFDPYLIAPTKNDPQGTGSSITYARRYALSSVFNIASEDDDDANSSTDDKINPNQIKQLHNLAETLASLYEWEPDKFKQKLGFQKNINHDLYGVLMNRINDGFRKHSMEKQVQDDTDETMSLPADIEHEDAGDRI